MAGLDYSTLLASLGGVDKAAAESDPFSGLSDFGNTLAGSVLKTAIPAGGVTTQYSPYATIPKYPIGEGIAAGLISGLLSGAATNLSDTYKTKQEDLSRQALRSVFSGNPLVQPEGMSNSVFSTVGKIADVSSIADAQEETDRKQRLADAITLKNTEAPASAFEKSLFPSVQTSEDAKFALDVAKSKPTPDPEEKTRAATAARLTQLALTAPSLLVQDTPDASNALADMRGESMFPNSPTVRQTTVHDLLDNRPAWNKIKGQYNLQSGGGYLTDEDKQDMFKGIVEAANVARTQQGLAPLDLNQLVAGAKRDQSTGTRTPTTEGQVTPDQARAILKQRGVAGY